MKAAAAALCLAVTGMERPSGRPKEPPGPLTPGTSAGSASPAMLDWLESFAVGRLPGPVARTMAVSPAVNLSNATEASIDPAPGEPHPFLTASASHCSAL